MPLAVNDRVSRHISIGGPRRFGTVSKVYKGKPSSQSNTARLQYCVLWDDTKQEECGYMDIGLQKEQME